MQDWIQNATRNLGTFSSFSVSQCVAEMAAFAHHRTVVPVLEAFGFERIIFGSSPASAGGSPTLADIWYKLVLESFRELAVSQDEMDKIFIDNAERIYSLT